MEKRKRDRKKCVCINHHFHRNLSSISLQGRYRGLSAFQGKNKANCLHGARLQISVRLQQDLSLIRMGETGK